MKASEYKMQRYKMHKGFLIKMDEDDCGDWVKWEEVEPLIKAYLDLTNTKNKRLGFTRIEVIK